MSKIDWNGAPSPERVKLSGQYVSLAPLSPKEHGEQLFESAQQPGAEDRFRYLFDTPPATQTAFAQWLDKASKSADPLFFAVIDHRTGRAEGRQALMRIDSGHGVIELGNILWGPAIAKSRAATEAFYLIADYALDTLGYRRLEWKCDDLNEPSKAAARRFGFKSEGIFRKHMVVKGQNRDTAWFSIVDREWPRLRSAYQRWLDPQNFDAVGQQRQKFLAFRELP